MNTTHFTSKWVGLCGAMVAITAVDFVLGPTAEYLNAHALLCATVQGAEHCAAFVHGQSSLGRFALPVAWAAYTLEGLVISGLLSLALAASRGGYRRWPLRTPGGAP